MNNFIYMHTHMHAHTYVSFKNDFVHFFANGWKALETTTICVKNIDEIVQPLFVIIYIKK